MTPGISQISRLHGRRHALFHFFGAGARHLHKDVHHGDDDLRVFFAGRFIDGEGAQQNGENHQQRGQLGIDKVAGDAAGDADFTLIHEV